MGKRIVLFLMCLLVVIGHLSAQVTKMSGIVLSKDDGLPVVGASVLIQGTTHGTITDVDGKFVLDNIKPTDKKVMVSFIGMKTQVVDVKSFVKVVLVTESEMMDEVMVVAYGTAKRSAFTGSASVVNAEKLSKRQTTNVVQALAGQVAGLQMTSGSGQPGGDAPTLIIRGIGSINADNDPLIIVDGMPYEGGWNNINPSDVESVSVLKDAASNALYGARGANGVIIITTKQAKAGEAVVTASAKWGVNTRGTIDYDYIKDPGEYYEAHYKALYNQLRYVKGLSEGEAYAQANKNMVGNTKENGGLTYNVYSYPENENLIGMNGKLNPNATLGRVVNGYMLYPDDWVDEAYSSALRQEYNVNIAGGTDKMQSYGSFGYLKDDGIVPSSNYERYSARFKGLYQAKKWMKYGANISYTHSNSASLTEKYDTDLSSFTEGMAPIYPVYVRNADGNILTDLNGKVYDYGTATAQLGLARPNHPNSSIQSSMLNQENRNGNTFNGNAFVDITFLKDFKFTFNVGTTVNEIRYYTTTNPYYGFGAEQNGTVTMYHYRTTTLNLQQILNYSHNFGKHNISVMLGHESYKYNYAELSASKKNMFSYWGNHELNGAVIDGSSAASYSNDYNTEGYFFRALYDYDAKYYFSASYRRDASSCFHPDNRWGNFWSVGAGWLLNKEAFLENQSWINMLKFKISYGLQGNDNLMYQGGLYRNYYPYQDQFTLANSNGDFSTSLYYKGNKDITWETSHSFNTGFDFTFWGGKLSGSAEYFSRKTTDMLYFKPVAASMGYSRFPENVGSMVNRGVEIDLNSNIIETKDFSWSVNLNLTHFKNKVLELAPELNGQMIDAGRIYREDESMFQLYLPKYAGVNPETGESQWALLKPDAEGNTVTTSYSTATENRFATGDILPKVYGGFGTSFTAYGFDLSISFAYQLGGRILDYTYQEMMSPAATGSALHKDMLNVWTSENKNTDVPRMNVNDKYTNRLSDRFLTSSDYLSLQNITFGYTLPKNLTRKLQIEGVRLYFVADNVALLTARKGLDPRQGYVASDNVYSPIRTISGGISLNF